jgi:photosystem II stability/assembly factor-like uncharacterized protein
MPLANGANWKPWGTGMPGPSISVLAVDPANPRSLLAAPGGMYRSTDGGTTWTKGGAGLPGQAGIKAIVFDRVRPGTVYAGTDGMGVFTSTDGGVIWRPTDPR